MATDIPNSIKLNYSTWLGVVFNLFALIVAAPTYAKDLPGASPTSYSVSASGAFQFQMPVVVPDGVNGVQPNLNIGFSSSRGNGMMGVGWSVTGLSSITRCSRTIATDGINGGVLHDENDRFCLNGERLVVVSGNYGAAGSEYRTEIDEFSKVVAHGSITNEVGGSAPSYFVVWQKDGTKMYYGNSASSRFNLPNKTSIHSWKLSHSYDRNGNYYEVVYDTDTENRLPDYISYTHNDIGLSANQRVDFEYEARADVRTSYIIGQPVTRKHRLKTLHVTRGLTSLRQYRMTYSEAPTTKLSRLDSVTECGLGTDNCMPPIQIEWQSESNTFNSLALENHKPPEPTFRNDLLEQFFANGQPIFGAANNVCNRANGCWVPTQREVTLGGFADVNGDGRVDQYLSVVLPDGTEVLKTYIKTATGWNSTSFDGGSGEPDWRLPKPLRNYKKSLVNHANGRFLESFVNQGELVDVNDDGLIDVVYAYAHYTDAAQSNASTIRRVTETYLNTGSGWELSLAYKPKDYLTDYITNGAGNNRIQTERSRLIDVNGDGLVDWVTSYFNYISTNSVTRRISYTEHKATYLNNGNGWNSEPTDSYEMPDVFAEHRSQWPALPHGQFVDVNADGLLDWVQAYLHADNPTSLVSNTWLNTGDGFSNNPDPVYKLNEAIYDNIAGWNDRAAAVQRGSFIDINADGRRDFVRSYQNYSNSKDENIVFNTGRGWQQAPAAYTPEFTHLDFTFTDLSRGFPLNTTGMYIDINRDGLTDYMQAYIDIYGDSHYNTWLNTGSGWNRVPSNNQYYPQSLFYDYSRRARGAVRYASFLDINYDGAPDLVESGKGIDRNSSAVRPQTARLNTLVRADEVQRITTTMGVEVEPIYGLLTDQSALYRKGTGPTEADSLHIQRPITVVSKLRTTNADLTGYNSANYHYSGAQFNRQGRGFLGFQSREVINQSSGIRQYIEYRQDYPFIGRVRESRTTEASVSDVNKWLSKTVNSYATLASNAGKTVFPYMSTSTTEVAELDANSGKKFRWSQKTYRYDTLPANNRNYGNVGRTITQTGKSATELLQSTVQEYEYLTPDEDEWLVAQVSKTITTATEPNVAASTIVRTNAMSYDTLGRLRTTTREPDTQDEKLKLITTYGYDNYGNVDEISNSITGVDAETRTQTIAYDPSHRLVRLLTNALDQESVTTYHALCDLPETITNANNQQSLYEYDNFCRQTKITDSAGVYENTSYLHSSSQTSTVNFDCTPSLNCQTPAKLKITSEVKGRAPTSVFFNHYNQPLLSRTQGMLPGQLIEQRSEYDFLGRTKRQSRPYFVGESLYWITSQYDKLDRQVASLLPYGSAKVTYDYSVDTLGHRQRTVTDTVNNVTKTLANALGQVAEIRDAIDNPIKYDYDAFGSLIQTQDSLNNIITIGYDNLGRRTSLDDPDLGLSLYTYDAFGYMRSQTDAKGQTRSMRYDELGRLKERDVPNLIGGFDTSVWTYDASPNGVGSVSSIKQAVNQTGNPKNETNFGYDEHGRPEAVVSYIRGQRFTEAFTYNADGDLDSRRYPDSGVNAEGAAQVFAIKYDYTNGYLSTISGLDSNNQICIEHWRADEYDALGRIKNETMGRLISTSRAFDQAQSVLKKISATVTKGNAAGVVQSIDYDYFANNSLKSRDDVIAQRNETFTYDKLDRLRFHNVVGGDTTEVRYNAIGNITYKSDVGSYDYSGQGGPHAVSRVDTSQVGIDPIANFQVNWEWNSEQPTNSQAQPRILDTNYEYDANGSITKQGDRLVYWTAFDKPSKMLRLGRDGTARGSVVEYDADFQRKYKREATFSALGVEQSIKEETYYIGKDYEKIIEQNGTVTHRYTIGAGNNIIQVERADGSDFDKPNYLLSDNLGSTNVVLNSLGEIEQRLQFDPWGMRVANSDVTVVNEITNRGFTGHEMDDEVGLINMNARIYDPYLGRFLSADPVLPDAFDMQQYNRYSYVSNNPLKYTDPTGNNEEPLEEVVVTGPKIEDEDNLGGGGGGGFPDFSGSTADGNSGNGGLGGNGGSEESSEEETTPEETVGELGKEGAELEELRRKIKNLHGIASRLNESFRDDLEKGLDRLQSLLDTLFGQVGRNQLICSACSSFGEIKKFFSDNLRGPSGTINDAIKHALGTRDAIVLNLNRFIPISPSITLRTLNALEGPVFLARTAEDKVRRRLGLRVPRDGHPGSRDLQGHQDILNNIVSFNAFSENRPVNIRDLSIFNNNDDDIITIGSGDF